MTNCSEVTPVVDRSAGDGSIVDTEFGRLCLDRQIFQKLACRVAKGDCGIV